MENSHTSRLAWIDIFIFASDGCSLFNTRYDTVFAVPHIPWVLKIISKDCLGSSSFSLFVSTVRRISSIAATFVGEDGNFYIDIGKMIGNSSYVDISQTFKILFVEEPIDCALLGVTCKIVFACINRLIKFEGYDIVSYCTFKQSNLLCWYIANIQNPFCRRAHRLWGKCSNTARIE